MSSTHLVVWIFSRMAQQLNCLWLCYSVKNTIETCGNGSIKKEATEISMSFQKKMISNFNGPWFLTLEFS